MKKYAILPLESQTKEFEGISFQTESLADVLIVHIPDNTDPLDVGLFRDKLIVAMPDKTVIVVPESVKFCRIKEIGKED